MFRFFQNSKHSLDSLLNLITDLVADGLLFFRLLFRSRTSLNEDLFSSGVRSDSVHSRGEERFRSQIAMSRGLNPHTGRLRTICTVSPMIWQTMTYGREGMTNSRVPSFLP